MKKQCTLVILFFTIMTSAQTSSLIDVVNSFKADKSALKIFYTVNESEEYYQRFLEFYSDWDKKVNSLDFNQLSQQEKVDYALLINLINKENYFLNIDYNNYKEVASVVGFADNLYTFIENRRRGEKPVSNKLAQDFSDAETAIDLKIKEIEKTPFQDWLEADKAARVIYSLRKTQDHN